VSPILGIIASQNYPRITSSYESIATVTVGSGGSSSVEFTSIPNTFKHLQVRGISRASSGNQYIKLRFNNDSTSIYTYHSLFGSGTSAVADAGTSQNGAGAITSVAGSISASIFSGLVIDVLDYENANKNKTIRSLDGFDSNGGGQICLNSGLWISTSVINRLDLIPSASTFAQYSHFALYGIRGA